MTATATLAAPESRVAGLLAAIADDPLLGERTIDANEAAPGRWQVIVYFDQPPDKAERAALARFGRFAIAELPETDWVAKSLEGLKPVRAGRFLVHGAHDRGRVKPNDIAIEIEAGQAFGTGHHGTTIGCLHRHRAGSQDAEDPERARCRHRLRRARHRAGETSQGAGIGQRHRPGGNRGREGECAAERRCRFRAHRHGRGARRPRLRRPRALRSRRCQHPCRSAGGPRPGDPPSLSRRAAR